MLLCCAYCLTDGLHDWNARGILLSNHLILKLIRSLKAAPFFEIIALIYYKMKNSNLFILGRADTPLLGSIASAESVAGSPASTSKVWRWGSDNLTPVALAVLSRSSTIHRRIVNDKADYICGRGFTVDPTQRRIQSFIDQCNGDGQTLRNVIQRVAFDRCLFGNAFVEMITDRNHSFLSLYHQDASRCRLSAESSRVVMHHNWNLYKPSEATSLPLFPYFEERADGTLRSVLHYKDYEPMFEHYGVPKYIAGLGASAIAYKTDRWNISRLDNAFQLSGVMILDGDVDTQHEAAEIARMAQERFSGKPGQVMFMVKNGVEGDTSKFIPMNSGNDGDWRALREQATSDILVAHSWFRTLSGLDYASGFSADRVLHEYNIALNTIIQVEQQEVIEPIRMALEDILSVDARSMNFVNRPPFEVKPPYMRVWEARKTDGYDYDPTDIDQQQFLSQL